MSNRCLVLELMNQCFPSIDDGWGCCCWFGRFVAVSQWQQNKTKAIEEATSLKSVSNPETDVTVNLTTFAELLAMKTAQKVSKRMDGPQ